MIYDYALLLDHKLSILTYLFLGLAILSLWFKRSPFIWGSFLLIAVGLGWYAGRLFWTAILFIVFYGSIVYAAYNIQNKTICLLISILTGIVSYILISPLHIIPGFSNWLIAKDLTLSPDAVSFSMYLNFDKPLVGLFILAFSGLPLISRKTEWWKTFKKTILILMGTIIGVSLLAYLMGYIRYDLKFNRLFFIWAFNNLIFISISEEAFFRGFIQRHLTERLQPYPYGSITALLLASVLFGTIHWAYGIKYMILATVAGIFYGIAYHKTKKIEASILTHFALNATHFIAFTYPALISSFRIS